MRTLFFTLISICSLQTFAQTNLETFQPLTEKTWKASGTWGDGSKFYQEITFNYNLNQKIIEASTIGFTDKAQVEIGPRNQGIRFFDTKIKEIRFWEFDIFGQLTEGKVLVDGKSHYYQYKYGDTIVTDGWEFQDTSTYIFKVGIYNEGKWEKVFLETTFHEVVK